MRIRINWREFVLLGFFLSLSLWLEAGVRREIKNEYVRKYQNKAIFLRLPVHGTNQTIYVKDTGTRLERSGYSQRLSFKVGEQVRITKVDFGGDSVRFKIASVDLQRHAELEFRFRFQLKEHFPQREVFNATLNSTFTEGVSYTQIDAAKEDFIKEQFSEFVQQLASSSDESTDFVIGKVVGQIPAYKEIQDKVTTSKNELEKVRVDFQKGSVIRRQLESDLRQKARELDRIRAAERKVKTLRNELSEDKRTLQKENTNLLNTLLDSKKQLKKMTGLNKTVQSLRGSVKLLQEGRTEISRRLEQLSRRSLQLEKENTNLSQNLEQTEKEKKSLREDVRMLTSNRKSLEARYIRMKRERQTLKNSVEFMQALSSKKRLESREDEAYQVVDLYLLSKKIGTFEIRVPEYSGQAYQIDFTMDSPETVKFSQDERRLHDFLGNELRIETNWQTDSETLKVVLLENEPQQTVVPRETVEWNWLFQGSISEPAHISLIVKLVNAEGKNIFLDSHDFKVMPGDLVNSLLYSFSPVSLVSGALIATLVVGVLLGWRPRSQPVVPKQVPSEKLVINKRF